MRQCVFALIWIIAATALGEPLLFEDDFEQGMLPEWKVVSGHWKVIADSTHPTNHLLQLKLKGGRGGVIRAGSERWRNYRVSCRLQILNPTGKVFHIKLGCRSNRRGSNFINMRSSGPAVIHNEGRNFQFIGSVADWPVEPGRWYEASIECAGPILTARAQQIGSRDFAEARFFEDSFKTGGIHLTVWMPEGEATVLFDDVRVVQVGEPESIKGGRKFILEDETVRISFDGAIGIFDLIDKRTGTRWAQTAYLGSLPKIEALSRKADGKSFVAQMRTNVGRIDVTFRLEGQGEVTVTLSPGEKGRHASLRYPLPSEPSTPEAELVLPTDEGICTPINTQELKLAGTYSYGQGGVIMPWFGLLVGEKGIMTLVETSDDFYVAVEKRKVGKETASLPRVVWLPSRDGLRYSRHLRYCLFDKGGYVAMAKRYRQFLIEQNRFRTLEEKAEEIPNVRKLIGAINILDQSPDDTVLDWMIAHGIRRALYSCGAQPKRIAKALNAGYVVNRYDIYTDIAGPELLKIWGKPRSETDHRRIGYPDECFIRRDGKPKPGFAYPVGAKGGVDPAGRRGKRVRCYNRCSDCKLQWLQRVIPPQLKAGYTARFIDVETATPLLECYSPKHLLTRTQDREARVRLFDYLRSLGQICSSEGGADWAAHALHYQEGSLTLVHFARLAGIYVGTKPFDLPESYVKTQLNPAIRVPLHELVFHDSTFMTWRWNHTPNRWRPSDAWKDWDLLHVLYAAMPIFVIHKNYLADQGERILQSYRDICGFAEKVNGAEMVGHRFITSDRMVQETRFANGWAVVVNFSHDPYKLADGTTLAARSARTFRFRSGH